jgi:hypothetical protein
MGAIGSGCARSSLFQVATFDFASLTQGILAKTNLRLQYDAQEDSIWIRDPSILSQRQWVISIYKKSNHHILYIGN